MIRRGRTELIGTAKYGVRRADGGLDEGRLRELAALPQIKMFEIKLSQGAKPGKGGILPGVKVTPEIAAIRGVPGGEDSISPSRHPEINSNDELLNFIETVKRVTEKPVGVKAVLGAYGWFDDRIAKVRERGAGPDFFTLDSGDGGTGAAPMALVDNVGLSIRESLPLVRDIINKHGLEERIPIVAAGKLTTPADVAWALCAGAGGSPASAMRRSSRSQTGRPSRAQRPWALMGRWAQNPRLTT